MKLSVSGSDMADNSPPISSARRALGLLRVVASGDPAGMRLIDVARQAGCSQPAAHRALRDLAAEGFVEQVKGGRRYRLALDFFVLASRAGHTDGLRDLARPALLRLSSTLTDTVFLLVRSGYDAVCLDRVQGPFPIRSFTGDIGGKIPLGLGQGSPTILAHLTEGERDAVINYNMPRLLDRGFFDEAMLRYMLEVARNQGWMDIDTGLIPDMAGVGVPVFDSRGHVVASLSVGTLSNRLHPNRLLNVVNLLKAEAEALGRRLNPFDTMLL